MLVLTLLAILLAGGLYMYRRNAVGPTQPLIAMTNEDIKRGWRELGFFCELDDEKKVWTLTGSRPACSTFLTFCAATSSIRKTRQTANASITGLTDLSR